MKLHKAGIILQIIHCCCCLIVIVCMPLYSAFYTTTFGTICFRIGVLFTLCSVLIPIGLIGTILSYIGCFSTNLKDTTKYLVGTSLTPVFTFIFWVLAVCFFVHYSGGV